MPKLTRSWLLDILVHNTSFTLRKGKISANYFQDIAEEQQCLHCALRLEKKSSIPFIVSLKFYFSTVISLASALERPVFPRI